MFVFYMKKKKKIDLNKRFNDTWNVEFIDILKGRYDII